MKEVLGYVSSHICLSVICVFFSEVYRLYDLESDDGSEFQKLSFERILDSHGEPIQSLITISGKNKERGIFYRINVSKWY